MIMYWHNTCRGGIPDYASIMLYAFIAYYAGIVDASLCHTPLVWYPHLSSSASALINVSSKYAAQWYRK